MKSSNHEQISQPNCVIYAFFASLSGTMLGRRSFSPTFLVVHFVSPIPRLAVARIIIIAHLFFFFVFLRLAPGLHFLSPLERASGDPQKGSS
jgi:hypothetical protein